MNRNPEIKYNARLDERPNPHKSREAFYDNASIMGRGMFYTPSQLSPERAYLARRNMRRISNDGRR